jgi:hypothetical protein
MGFHKLKQNWIGNESHENYQIKNISQNEIESDNAEDQVVPKK